MGAAAAPTPYNSLASLQHAVNMKIVFLLALAGLASCRSILPGGDQARNVELEYTYIDEHGQPIRVKVQTDLINLSGIREVELRKPEPVVQHVFVPAPAPIPFGRKIELKAPEPEIVYVQAPEPKTVEVEVDLPDHFTVQPHRFVVPAPTTKTVKIQTPEPEIKHVLIPAPTTHTLQTKKSFDEDEDDFGSAEK